jgi:hypothetical protein
MSDNGFGARQPSDCTTVGDRFMWQELIACCQVMMTCTLRNNRRSVFSVHGRCRGYIRKWYGTLLMIPCGGGFEYLHRNPASHRRRRKRKSQIWDSKLWSRVLWESDPKMSALARAGSNWRRQIRPLIRESAPHQQTSNCLTVIKIWS